MGGQGDVNISVGVPESSVLLSLLERPCETGWTVTVFLKLILGQLSLSPTIVT